jgi:hypothetical protein
MKVSYSNIGTQINVSNGYESTGRMNVMEIRTRSGLYTAIRRAWSVFQAENRYVMKNTAPYQVALHVNTATWYQLQAIWPVLHQL